MMDPLTNAQIRTLKARGQLLKATLKIGKEGVSAKFLAALDEELKRHELVKVKFDDFKEQKKDRTVADMEAQLKVVKAGKKKS